MAAVLLTAAAATAVVGLLAPGAAGAGAAGGGPARQAASQDAADLRLAASAIEGQALQSGALRRPIHSRSPAVVVFRADEALIRAALRHDPGRRPVDTRAVMGPVPFDLAHRERHRPGHRRITGTRALHRFTHSVPVGGSPGIGAKTRFRGAVPAPYRHPNGMYVDPRLPRPVGHPTIGEVALRSALRELGQPYVWGGAGPSTFDCSGLSCTPTRRPACG
jgi:hypothetical protein